MEETQRSPARNGAGGYPIPKLREPVILYVDERADSRQAENLLRSSGQDPFITHDPVDPLKEKPLVVHIGACLQGIDAIDDWLGLLSFWHRTGLAKDLFREQRSTAPYQE